MVTIGIFMKRMAKNHKNNPYCLEVGNIFQKADRF